MERAYDLQGLVRVSNLQSLGGEDFDKFHVDTDTARGSNASKELVAYLNIHKDNPQHILFIGHGGCGKSTELYRASRELESEFHIINFSIKEETDTTDLDYTDLLFIILHKLIEDSKDLRKNNELLKNLISYWNDEKLKEIIYTQKASADVEAQANIGILTRLSIGVKGLLSTGKESKLIIRKHMEPRLKQLIDNINDLVTIIKQEHAQEKKFPLIIIDNLEKIDIPLAQKIFLEHKDILTSLKLHVIYTFPIYLHYSPNFSTIKDSFNYCVVMSMIKIREKDGTINKTGVETVRKIIEKRAAENLFSDDAIKLIIEHSGGLLRNVFEMIVKAALDAFIAKKQMLDLDDARRAYLELRSDYQRTIAKKHLKTLVSLHEDVNKKPLDDGNLMELLRSAAVIEYNGDRWCGIHPAVVDILKEKGLIQ